MEITFPLEPLFEMEIVVLREYVPPRTLIVPPAATTETAFVIVAKGWLCVPGFESLPFVAT